MKLDVCFWHSSLGIDLEYIFVAKHECANTVLLGVFV
jgi:hypothetical protein